MAWSTVFGPDAFTATQYTALPTYNAAYAQNYGAARISTNGTSAGCASAARCYLVSAPANDQSGAFTIVGSSFDLYWGIAIRYTDEAAGFWGGVGYVAFKDVGSGLRLERLDGSGSHTTLGTVAYTPATNDVLRIEIIGTAIDVLINGSSQISTTDATHASGSVSLWFNSSIDDSLNMSVDAFTVQEWAADAGQPTMRRWGGVPFMGGQGIGQKGGGGGRMWGRRRSGIFVPSRFQEAA